jgi:putative FmdB family regulatory protein
MPLYEYKCDGCGEVFEVIQKFSDEPVTVHQKCGGSVHRLLSAPAFQFKGSGWYATDYAKSGSGAPKSDNSESPAKSSDSSAKVETKTSESKPSESKSSESKTSESKPAASSDKSKSV